MSDDQDTIRPRTKGERDAFIQGYAEAVNIVDKFGMAEARSWLRGMVEVEHPNIFEESSP